MMMLQLYTEVTIENFLSFILFSLIFLIKLLFYFYLLLDLKPDNIGFAADGTIKLLDVGLCVCIKKHIIDSSDEIYDMSGGAGSLRYMAPEVALHNNYNEKVDIYSFGIILWQMARDRIPFQAFSVESFMRAVVHGNCRPKLDKAWPPRFCQLLEMCWHKDYSKRPTASQLVIELTLLIDEAQMDTLKKRNNFLEMSFGSQ